MTDNNRSTERYTRDESTLASYATGSDLGPCLSKPSTTADAESDPSSRPSTQPTVIYDAWSTAEKKAKDREWHKNALMLANAVGFVANLAVSPVSPANLLVAGANAPAVVALQTGTIKPGSETETASGVRSQRGENLSDALIRENK